MDLGIAGKRAVVAASTSGLGLGTARALGEAGCEVVVSGRDPDRMAAAAATVANSHPITGDVSTVAGAQAFIDACVEELGGVDILVTNAGGPPPGNFTSTDIGAYSAAIEQNLISMAAMCKAVVPSMQEQQWGRIVAITSLSVRLPMANLILSNTARTGLTSLLKTLAREVASDGITVNTIQPGLHLTPRIEELYSGNLDTVGDGVPAGHIGDADDFGQIAAFMCSQQASFMTGASIPVDGGADSALQ